MDILKYLSEYIWDFLMGMYPEVVSLLLRWALLLFFLCMAGQLAKQLYREGLKNTLLIQILGIIGSIIACVSIPLGFIFRVPENLRGIIILFSISAWLLLPYLVPKLIIRSFGYQVIVCRVLYIAETIILSLQIIICIFTR